MYVANLPTKTTKNEIRDYFEAACGEIEDVNIPLDKDKSRPEGRGIAFVIFKEKEGLANGEKLSGTEFKPGRFIVTSLAKAPNRGTKRSKGEYY